MLRSSDALFLNALNVKTVTWFSFSGAFLDISREQTVWSIWSRLTLARAAASIATPGSLLSSCNTKALSSTVFRIKSPETYLILRRIRPDIINLHRSVSVILVRFKWNLTDCRNVVRREPEWLHAVISRNFANAPVHCDMHIKSQIAKAKASSFIHQKGSSG